ncbi:MAG: histone H1 [Candidatus Kapaibacterium sp.]
MSRYESLVSLVQSFEGDFAKFYGKGNKAAGTRVRKHMQELRKLCAELRTEVQNMKSAEAEGK